MRKPPRRKRTAVALVGLCLIATGFAVHFDRPGPGILACMLALSLLRPSGRPRPTSPPRSAHRQADDVIHRTGAPWVRTAAIRLLVDIDGQRRSEARDHLLAKLPTLQEPDYRELEPEDRSALWQLGLESDIPAVSLELLALYQRVADPLALPTVRRMAEGRCKAAYDPRVAEAARACAVFLEEVQSHQHDAATLLRPANGQAPDTLLRPAGGTPETSEEQLLRPVGRPDRADVRGGQGKGPR